MYSIHSPVSPQNSFLFLTLILTQLLSVEEQFLISFAIYGITVIIFDYLFIVGIPWSFRCFFVFFKRLYIR